MWDFAASKAISNNNVSVVTFLSHIFLSRPTDILSYWRHNKAASLQVVSLYM